MNARASESEQASKASRRAKELDPRTEGRPSGFRAGTDVVLSLQGGAGNAVVSSWLAAQESIERRSTALSIQRQHRPRTPDMEFTVAEADREDFRNNYIEYARDQVSLMFAHLGHHVPQAVDDALDELFGPWRERLDEQEAAAAADERALGRIEALGDAIGHVTSLVGAGAPQLGEARIGGVEASDMPDVLGALSSPITFAMQEAIARARGRIAAERLRMEQAIAMVRRLARESLLIAFNTPGNAAFEVSVASILRTLEDAFARGRETGRIPADPVQARSAVQSLIRQMIIPEGNFLALAERIRSAVIRTYTPHFERARFGTVRPTMMHRPRRDAGASSTHP